MNMIFIEKERISSFKGVKLAFVVGFGPKN
jgi:hypothetical protein